MSATPYIHLGDLGVEGRRPLRATGPDAARFLQGTVSGDVSAAGSQAVAAALLTVKGKIISDVVIVGEGETFDLWLPETTFDAVRARLERHVIMDDVTFEAPTELAAALWLDPEAPPLNGAEIVCRAARYPTAGQWLQGPPGALEAALAAGQRMTIEAWTAHRVREGDPAWGREVVSDAFPPEVGFVRAVSYDKGCFMGQEPLARIHARGQVNRVLVQVTVACTVARALEVMNAPSGDAPLAHPDREAAGSLTSVAASAGATGPLDGLAVVRRAFAHPDAVLTMSTGEAVTVRSGPLGDDEGVAQGRSR